MVDEILALMAANPMVTALGVIVVFTAGVVGAMLTYDALERRQLIALHEQLTALKRERDRLKDQL